MPHKSDLGGEDEDWLAMAREKLEQTKALVAKTESEYDPYEPMDKIWKDTDQTWDAPSYIGVFKKGDVVGYHCRNEEIETLQAEVDRMS